MGCGAEMVGMHFCLSVCVCAATSFHCPSILVGMPRIADVLLTKGRLLVCIGTAGLAAGHARCVSGSAYGGVRCAVPSIACITTMGAQRVRYVGVDILSSSLS